MSGVRRSRALWSVAVLAGLASACGGEPETPEAQVRHALAALEAAAESGDVSAFKGWVSERYGDDTGHDKRALGAFVAFHVLRNPNREVVVRVRDVRIESPGKASVTVVAATAGLTATGPDAALRGNVYQIDARLEEEAKGDWRVIWARWKPTAPSELL